MNSETTAKRAKIVSKICAILVAALGLYIIGVILIPLWRNFQWDEPLFDIIFMFIFPIPMVAFGCYCIFVAYRTWLKISIENARRISFVASLVLFMLAGVTLVPVIKKLQTLFPTFESHTCSMVTTPLLMLPAGIFYWLCKKYLIKWLALPASIDWKQREKTSKIFFGLLAFLSFGAFGDIVMQLRENLELAEERWWWLSLLFLPLLLAVLIYKVGVGIALRNKPKNLGQGKPASITKTDKETTPD